MKHLEGQPVNDSTYKNLGCRCSGCRKASAERIALQLKTRKAQRSPMFDFSGNPLFLRGKQRMIHPTAPHGTMSSYCNYRCQCDPCLDAHIRSMARRKHGL